MSLIETMSNRNVIFTLVIVGLLAGVLLMPDLYISPYAHEEERYRGEVLAVDNSHVEQYGLVKGGSQRLTVKLLEGPYKGREVDAGNDLLGRMESDKIFQVGDQAYLIVTTLGGEITAATAYEHYRLPIEGFLLLLFATLLICFTGWGGVRALLSFVFAIVMLWKILLPGILQGNDPIWLALGVVTTIAGVTLLLVAGVSCTALVAWLGAMLGILLTTALAMILLPRFQLHGAIQPFSETLLYSGFADLDLGRLFIAAIFVGASGAVIDTAIDLAAAMREVITKRPDLSIKELTASGFTVGKAMVSTMVTTLLMAYMSGSMALLMVLASKGIPPVQILNLNFIAAEILRTVVGSFGLVTVAPFTALVGGILYVKWQPAETRESSRLITTTTAALQED
jgi:uncharacterized membrane protein